MKVTAFEFDFQVSHNDRGQTLYYLDILDDPWNILKNKYLVGVCSTQHWNEFLERPTSQAFDNIQIQTVNHKNAHIPNQSLIEQPLILVDKNFIDNFDNNTWSMLKNNSIIIDGKFELEQFNNVKTSFSQGNLYPFISNYLLTRLSDISGYENTLYFCPEITLPSKGPDNIPYENFKEQLYMKLLDNVDKLDFPIYKSIDKVILKPLRVIKKEEEPTPNNYRMGGNIDKIHFKILQSDVPLALHFAHTYLSKFDPEFLKRPIHVIDVATFLLVKKYNILDTIGISLEEYLPKKYKENDIVKLMDTFLLHDKMSTLPEKNVIKRPKI